MNREQNSAGDVKVGWLARSKAGHDKDQIYVIVGMEQGSLYVADGRLKTVEDPKRKNPRHLQTIKLDIKELLPDNSRGPLRNEDIKYALRQYRDKFL